MTNVLLYYGQSSINQQHWSKYIFMGFGRTLPVRYQISMHGDTVLCKECDPPNWISVTHPCCTSEPDLTASLWIPSLHLHHLHWFWRNHHCTFNWFFFILLMNLQLHQCVWERHHSAGIFVYQQEEHRVHYQILSFKWKTEYALFWEDGEKSGY